VQCPPPCVRAAHGPSVGETKNGTGNPPGERQVVVWAAAGPEARLVQRRDSRREAAMTSRRLPSFTAAAMFPSRLASISPALAGQRREPHPHLTLRVVVVLAKAPAIALPLRVLVGGPHPDPD
jgi:hypothetical protein